MSLAVCRPPTHTVAGAGTRTFASHCPHKHGSARLCSPTRTGQALWGTLRSSFVPSCLFHTPVSPWHLTHGGPVICAMTHRVGNSPNSPSPPLDWACQGNDGQTGYEGPSVRPWHAPPFLPPAFCYPPPTLVNNGGVFSTQHGCPRGCPLSYHQQPPKREKTHCLCLTENVTASAW